MTRPQREGFVTVSAHQEQPTGDTLGSIIGRLTSAPTPAQQKEAMTTEFKANPGTGPSYQPVTTIEGIMAFMEGHLRRAKTIQDSVDRAVDIITAAQPVGKGVFLTIHLNGTVTAFATSAVEARTMLVHREQEPSPVPYSPGWINSGALARSDFDLPPVTPQRPLAPMNEYADSATLMAAVIASAN